jgi:hypothetical protein
MSWPISRPGQDARGGVLSTVNASSRDHGGECSGGSVRAGRFFRSRSWFAGLQNPFRLPISGTAHFPEKGPIQVSQKSRSRMRPFPGENSSFWLLGFELSDDRVRCPSSARSPNDALFRSTTDGTDSNSVGVRRSDPGGGSRPEGCDRHARGWLCRGSPPLFQPHAGSATCLRRALAVRLRRTKVPMPLILRRLLFRIVDSRQSPFSFGSSEWPPTSEPPHLSWGSLRPALSGFYGRQCPSSIQFMLY